MFSPSFNTPHLCLKTIYANERPLLGKGGTLIWEGALIKKFSSKGGRSFERGALSRGGAHSNKYGMRTFTYYFHVKKEHNLWWRCCDFIFKWERTKLKFCIYAKRQDAARKRGCWKHYFCACVGLQIKCLKTCCPLLPINSQKNSSTYQKQYLQNYNHFLDDWLQYLHSRSKCYTLETTITCTKTCVF